MKILTNAEYDALVQAINDLHEMATEMVSGAQHLSNLFPDAVPGVLYKHQTFEQRTSNLRTAVVNARKLKEVEW